MQPIMQKTLAKVTIGLVAFASVHVADAQQGTGKASQAHMHQMDFDTLVARFESPARAKWQKPETVIAGLGSLAGKTVADIGAGTGYFAFPIAKQAAKVIAIDIDDRFLRYIEEKKGRLRAGESIETRRTTPDSAGLKKAEADVVLIVDTFHHIDDRVSYLKRLRKGLKKGGMLVIVDFKKEKTPEGPPLEFRLDEREVESELKAAGFPMVTTDRRTLPYQYIITAR
jgi:2-polyprenyl-3-methyl-5-hydroxy-6-metoxy-1,4-benzoquinol methylase